MPHWDWLKLKVFQFTLKFRNCFLLINYLHNQMEAKSANKAPSDNKLLSALCRKSLIWVPIMRTKFWLHWVLVYNLTLFFRNKKMQFLQIQFSNKVTRMSNACWTCCFDNNSSSKFISKLFHTNELGLFWILRNFYVRILYLRENM